jgi:hypothetical protein
MGKLLAVVALVPMVACGRHESADPPEVGAPLVAKPSLPAAAPPAHSATTAEIIAHMSYADALALALPHMTDTTNEDSSGTEVMALWASSRMAWADVGVAQDETSWALTMKDSDAARGKRLCTTGQVVQIKVEKTTEGGKVYVGLTMSNGGNIFRFTGVRSSGALVAESYARFCGVVTGRYDYSNSAGGTGHAVSLVGMFDLPENKVKPAMAAPGPVARPVAHEPPVSPASAAPAPAPLGAPTSTWAPYKNATPAPTASDNPYTPPL